MANQSRIEILAARSNLLRLVRDFFYAREFIEVQTPTLSRDTMVDQAIDPIRVQIEGEEGSFFLQTSPEFAMKRLLQEGVGKIFEITPAFRNAEFGKKHNPEFTMLEWYRVGDNYEAGMNLLQEFTIQVLQKPSIQTTTYKHLFEDRFQIDPHSILLGELIEICHIQKIELPDDSDVDGLLQLLMAERIEPHLGHDQPVIVFDWPASQSALAQLRMTSAGYQVAERFELYVDGVELANGYHELCDAEQQENRLAFNNQCRQANGLSPLPIQSFLLNEMKTNPLPHCCGVAVGFDRLLMVQQGLETLSDTLVFDIKKA